LKSLPPTLIQVGSAETLLADATRFAAAAGAADVRVTLEIWPHMIHAWHLWNAHLEPGCRALGNAGTFIRECLCDARRTEALALQKRMREQQLAREENKSRG
jgi:epsilon-lactone hydrolase